MKGFGHYATEALARTVRVWEIGAMLTAIVVLGFVFQAGTELAARPASPKMGPALRQAHEDSQRFGRVLRVGSAIGGGVILIALAGSVLGSLGRRTWKL